MTARDTLSFAGYRLWCLTGNDAAAAASAISHGEVDGVFVSRSRGFSGSDLGCLSTMENLRILAMDDLENIDISGVAGLVGLEFLSIGSVKGHLRIDGLTRLKHLRIMLAPEIALPDEGLPNLRHLAVWNFAGTDLAFLEKYQALEHFEFSEAKKLTSLDGIEDLTELVTVKIAYCPKLSGISAIAALHKLRTLEIVNAKKITEYSAIEHLGKLSKLMVNKAAPIASLNIIEGLKHLESVVLFGTTVEDHNLSPLMALPKLSHIHIDNKKGYAPTPKEIEAFISPRKHQT